MANTLTGLIPTIYEALDEVSRELVGAIPASTINGIGTSTDRIAKDQTIRFPIVPSVSSSTAITPGLYAPDSGDQTIGYADCSISKAQMVPVRWTGNEQISVKSNGKYQNIQKDRFAQAMRTLVNEIEVDLLSAAYKGASRAHGTAGTTPFGSSIGDASSVRKILDDNGCPDMGRTLVLDTTAGVNVRNLTGLNTVSAAGTDRTLRAGILLPLQGLDIRESAQVAYHTKGTMTGSDCTAIEPVGEVTVACDGSNSGTVLAGDVITRGNEGGSSADTNKYVIYSGSTLTGAAAGNFILNAPGVRFATAATDEWTIGNSYRANVAFHKNALHLFTRLPELPEEGDMADDRTIVIDPVTGLAFEIAMYKQYKQVHYEVGICWGVKAVKPEWIAILLG